MKAKFASSLGSNQVRLVQRQCPELAGQIKLFRRYVIETNFPTIAGFISTALFAVGTLPMLIKAFRTKNLASYSLGNILLSNVGNIIYSIYVFNLPLGPVWFLHSYNLISTGLMLVLYLKYQGWCDRPRSACVRATTRFPLPLCSSPAT